MHANLQTAALSRTWPAALHPCNTSLAGCAAGAGPGSSPQTSAAAPHHQHPLLPVQGAVATAAVGAAAVALPPTTVGQQTSCCWLRARQNMPASSAAAAALAARCATAAGGAAAAGAAAAGATSKGAPSMPPAPCMSLTISGACLGRAASKQHSSAPRVLAPLCCRERRRGGGFGILEGGHWDV